MLLKDYNMLIRLHTQLDAIIKEIDDDEVVPDRYQSNLAAVVAEHDSEILNSASRVIHRLFLNAKFPKLNDLQANYVKFDEEVSSGERTG